MDELEQVIETEIERELNNQEIKQEVKKKRGRPKGSKNKKTDEVVEQVEQVDSLIPISSIVNIILDRLKLSQLSKIEAETLDINFSRVFFKYIDFNYSEEVNLLLVVLIIVSSRYKEFKSNKDTEKVNDNKES